VSFAAAPVTEHAPDRSLLLAAECRVTRRGAPLADGVGAEPAVLGSGVNLRTEVTHLLLL